jgi:outer membrane protein assembly complex protein YaeT
MDTPRLPITNIPYWHTFCRCRVVLVILLLFLSPACTSHQVQVPQPESPEPFPEVAHITFTGNTHFSSSTLRQAMATKQRPLFPPWKHGEPYNPPTLEADLLRLKKFYFDHGFLEAKARLEKLDEDPARHRVRIVIALDEGMPTLVTSVSLDGTVPPELPAVPTLLKDLPLRPQQRISKEDFDRSKTLLLTRLHNAGYARAEIVPRTEVDPEQHTAAVTLTLVPGAQTAFGRISIHGEQQVEERAIRHQLTIHEGQRFSDKALTASTDAIYNLGMFQAVTPRALNPEAADEPLDVEFEVIERKPHSLQFGIGYSTTEGFRTEGQWTYRNLFRGAQQLSLLGRFSSFEQKAEVKLHLPYFLAERTAFTQTLFARNQEKVGINPSGSFFGVQGKAQPTFDLFSVGTESRVEHLFTETLSGALGLNFSRNEFRHVDQAALVGFDPAIAKNNTLLVQFAEVQWNTSDSRLNPSRGLVLRGRIDHATTALVSDVSFVKLVLEGRHYLPLGQLLGRPFLFATRLKVGGIEPYGTTNEVPFNVRFFAGGAGSVRGFTLNRLGPLNKDGDPIGGMSLIEGSAELRFPLFGELGAVLFIDTGNVFRAPFTYRLDALRYAVGPGIRYNTPVGPFRLDVGIIVDRRPGEQFGRVEFSIGQAF